MNRNRDNYSVRFRSLDFLLNFYGSVKSALYINLVAKNDARLFHQVIRIISKLVAEGVVSGKVIFV